MAREAALFLFKISRETPAGLMHLLGREDVSDYRLNIPIGNIYGLLSQPRRAPAPYSSASRHCARASIISSLAQQLRQLGDARVATLSDRGISVTFAAAERGVGFQAQDRWLAML